MVQPSIDSRPGGTGHVPRHLVNELLSVGGAIREAAAGAHNLVELIRSQRVGARPLAEAIPTCVEGAPPEMLRRLEIACQSVIGKRDPDVSALVERVIDGQRGLRAASLHRASRIGARARLGLEVSVSALARDLSALSRSAELLGAASTPRKVVVELDELLASAVPFHSRGDGDGEGRGEGGAFRTDPRIATAMIDLARSLSSDPRQPLVSRDRDGRLRLRFARANGSDPDSAAAPTPSLVSAAASLVGHAVIIDSDQIELLF